MDGALVTLTTVSSRLEAEFIVGMLDANGVRAVVATDDAGGQEPQLQLQGVRVRIAAEDADLARDLLASTQ